MKTRIKELRESKNLTQTALSVIVGCSQNTISRIELEEASINAELLIEFSKYFNVSIEYILYQTDQRNSSSPISFSSLPPRISKYIQKLQQLSPENKEAVFVLIDHFTNNTIN